MAAKSESNEICITRLYDAKVARVWDAWTDSQQVAHWWGPRGFTLTSHSKDVRPGGTWAFTLHGPDGVDYPNKVVYLEVEPGKRLVYDHGTGDDRPPLFRVTVLFLELAGKTQMEFRMRFPSVEVAQSTRKFIKDAEGESTWDRLGEYLAKADAGRELFVLNRTFEAPIDRLYELWTSPEHLVRWMAPKGFEMRFLHADIRPGGSSHSEMWAGSTMKMFGRVNYLELSPPSRIVYIQQFCDAEGNPARHPMAPTWPQSMRTTVLFTEEGPEETRVTLTWEPVETSSPEEVSTFVQARRNMHGGWTGSLDKLEAFLSEQA